MPLLVRDLLDLRVPSSRQTHHHHQVGPSTLFLCVVLFPILSLLYPRLEALATIRPTLDAPFLNTFFLLLSLLLLLFFVFHVGMPLANDHHYTPRQPLNRRTLRHAPSTPLLQHLPHPSYEYNSEFANRYNHPPPRPPNPDQYVTHTLHSSTVHWSGVPHHRLPAIAIPGSSNASAYGDPHTAAHLVTVTSFDPALERERNKARITNHQNFLPRPFVRKDTLYDSFNRSNKNLTEVDGAGDIRKLLQGANITSIKNRVSQDFRRVLGRRSSEAQMNNRYSGSPKKTPLEHLKHLLPSRARARREEEEARRKEAEAFLRSGKRNAGHARIIQIPPHHHMNPTDSLSSGEREEYMQRTEAEIAEDRKRVGEFLFGDRPTLDLTERRSKQKRATGVSDSVMDPYLHKPLPVPGMLSWDRVWDHANHLLSHYTGT